MTNIRIFVSYARTDGAESARALRRRLEDAGLNVWQDLVALQGGRDWWSQIEEALRSKELEHLVLMMTPEALSRPVIRREIRLARQEGKQVHPVRGPGLDLSNVPQWIGHVIDVDIPEQWDRLVLDLQSPGRQHRVPMMAPEPPADFVPRHQEFAELKAALLTRDGEAKGGGLTAITAALRGAGGYGKTTLAKALAHDPDVQEAFSDGVLWVELGERPSNLQGVIIDLIQRITGDRPVLETLNAAASAFGEALGEKRILLVVDDCWSAADLTPFLQGGRNTTRLVTTRLDRVLPVQAFRLPVDAMRPAEAVDLLGAGLPDAPAHRPELQALAGRLGEWAQLLKLANGFMRNRVSRGEALAPAIATVNRRLDEKGLAAFDARAEGERTSAIARTIEVSLDLLDPAERARFGELAVFPEDVDIPIDVAAALWSGDLSLDDVEDLLTELHGLSLLLVLDLERRTFRLHDTTRAYLRAAAGLEGLKALAARFVVALAVTSTPAAKRYDLLYRPHHLDEAGDRAGLDALLTDPAWIDAKIAALGGVDDIVADYKRFANPDDPLHSRIGRALRLAAGPIARDVRQAMPQLFGRLLAYASSAFLARVQSQTGGIYETRPALVSPGAELARLEGHSEWVLALAALPDGRLASGSLDKTLRLWDPTSGAELARLEGHDYMVTAVAVLRDRRLASGSEDATIRFWDPASGAEVARLEGHRARVNALVVLADGRLASGSEDSTIRLWDPASGAEVARLEGHRGSVNALAVLPNGRLVSGSEDTTIRLWDPESGAELATLQGKGESVCALAVLPDGRLASGHEDTTIRFWDPASGAELTRLEGHRTEVNALVVLPDGRLASGARDKTIRLWDPASGAELARLEGHGGDITALAVLPDGRLASGSFDKTIRLWDPASGSGLPRLEGHSGSAWALAVLNDGRLASGSGDDPIVCLWDSVGGAKLAELQGHGGPIKTLVVLPDGRLASGSWDRTIRLWDPTSGAELGRLEGHGGPVMALDLLPDGRLVSGSLDKTIRLWDLARKAESALLEGHGSAVTDFAVLSDGRFASSSEDNTIRLWDSASGVELARLEGHGSWVNALVVLPDGRLASASGDATIRFWDPASGAEVARLEGHRGGVSALVVLPDGRLASGARDKTIRLWDPESGAELAQLELDSEVRALAAEPDGQLVAGDGLGRIHWLALKGGVDGEGKGRLLATPGVFPSNTGAPSSATAAQRVGPVAIAQRLDVGPTAGRPEAQGRRQSRRRSGGLWVVVVLVLAIVAAATAGVMLGPAVGWPHAREVWEGALKFWETLSR